jgi:PAS domain S-box-containing protein
MPPQDQSQKTAWYLVLVFALLTLGIMAAGYLYFQKQKDQITADKKNDLAAIADLKMNQIDNWRKERLADARMISENRMLAIRAQQLMKDPLSGHLEEEVPGWMALRERSEEYAMGFLFDANGKLRCTVNGPYSRHATETPIHVLEALRARTIAFSDLEHADSASDAYLDLLVPLIIPQQADTVTVGLLVLRINPAGMLFPLVQAWPLPSPTAETILLQRKGDAVQYMNPPAELKDVSSEIHLPGGTDRIPAAMFTKGADESAIGPDYRGIQVLAALRRIPNSTWFIVAKIDLDEIHAPIREHAYLAIVLVVVLMFAAWANVAAIWRRQRADFYRKQFEVEVERHALEKHHAFLTKYANDIILLMDEDLMIQDANDRALTAYGYTRKELFALSGVTLHAQEAREGFTKQIETLRQEGAAVVETVHQRKDGTRFPVESSSRVIRVEDKVFYQSIMRDITQRKAAEQAMLESEARFRAVFQKAGIGIALTEPGGRFLETNHALHEMFGYTAEELKQFTFEMLMHPDERRSEQNPEDQSDRERLDDQQRAERRYVHKDGHVVWARLTSTVVTNADGREQYGLSMVTNVTKRKRAEEVQSAIYKISEAANAVENPAEVYRSIHRILSGLMPADNFYIALYDASRDLISFPYFVDQFDEIPAPRKPGRTLTAYVLRTGRPLLASPKVFEGLVAQGEVETLGAPSLDWLGVPLKVEDRVIGVMAVQSYTEGVRFGKEEADILSFVSNQVALATERKQAEEALRQSETRYRRLVEQLPAVTYVMPLGDNSSVAYISPQIESILGYNADGLRGQAPGLWHQLIHPEDREATARAFQKSFTDRKPFAAEYRLLSKKGNIVWMRDEAVVVHDEAGMPLCMQGLLFDITDRKQAETELYHSRQMLQLVLDTIPQRVFWKDRASRYLGCNRSFAHDAGLQSPEDILGKSDFELSWLQSANGYRADDSAVMDMDTPRINFEEPQIRTNGELLWLQTSKVPLHDRSGNVIGVLGTYEDVTSRKQQEESLRKLLRAVEQTDEVIFMTEVDGRITYVNPAFEKVYGFTSAEALGKTPRLIKSGMQKPAYYPRFWADLLAGKSVRGEQVNKSKDGNLVWVEGSVNPVVGTEGSIVGFIAVQEDITSRKKADEERRNLEAQVMQMQKMESIGTLAGGVAHDFNNILGIILGHCSLIGRVINDPARIAKSVDAMNKAVQRGASLVRQILTFARKTDVLFEQVRLGDVIAEFVKMLEETFPKTILFEVALENRAAIIDADRTQLHQTLLNLCVNARDAMPNGGKISITMDQVSGNTLRERFPDSLAASYERVRVADTGTGMDEQTRLRIFEPFFTTKAHGKGTGLGLAVVYGIINSHHGYIDVESEFGKGTTFSLFFPLPEAPAESAVEGTAREEDAGAGGNETILLVEDEEMLRELLTGLLKAKGYTVLAAADGEEAVRIYEKQCKDIDLVVTDMGLPRLSGADAFAEMRKINPSARVILASGYVEPQIKSTLIADGARAFIQKPYVPAEVLQVVRTTIDEKA